jgi:chromatin remodeling complex protein RSC6
MSTEVATETVTKDVSTAESLKSVLATLCEQASVIKTLMNTVKNVLKDNERQGKELEKLRNRRTRVKTERSANALPSGITKPVAISDELARFLKVEPGTLVPRNEVTKGVSGYVKSNELSDPSNKQKFVLDDRPAAKVLRTLLGNPTEDVTYFNLQRYLKHHYIFDKDAVVPAKQKKKVTVVVPEPVPEPVVPETPAKKKILVKKKKSELTEDTS